MLCIKQELFKENEPLFRFVSSHWDDRLTTSHRKLLFLFKKNKNHLEFSTWRKLKSNRSQFYTVLFTIFFSHRFDLINLQPVAVNLCVITHKLKLPILVSLLVYSSRDARKRKILLSNSSIVLDLRGDGLCSQRMRNSRCRRWRRGRGRTYAHVQRGEVHSKTTWTTGSGGGRGGGGGE